MADSVPDPLVSCRWLAERLEAPDVRVLDATWFLPGDARDARALYAEQRIPGAAFFDIDEIADHDTDLPHMLPSPEQFAARMRRMGIGDGARIVIYDAHGLFSAARAWWMFRAMGHEDVSVLDGGFPAWRATGFPLEVGPPTMRTERHFTARYRADLVRDLSQMRRAVETGRAQVLDARPKDRFDGKTPEPRPGLRGGHMPGAHNIPVTALVDSNGVMRAREDLEKVFAAHGVTGRNPVICTCGSGITAAVIALALARVGRWDAPIYDGAWAEWGARDDTPVATEI